MAIVAYDDPSVLYDDPNVTYDGVSTAVQPSGGAGAGVGGYGYKRAGGAKRERKAERKEAVRRKRSLVPVPDDEAVRWAEIEEEDALLLDLCSV